jgi:hypothetical protein
MEINVHLKVSLDEVIISLTLDHSFMNRIIESDLDAKDEKVQINGIEFINNIGNNKFWNEQLGNYEEYIGKMSAKFAI